MAVVSSNKLNRGESRKHTRKPDIHEVSTLASKNENKEQKYNGEWLKELVVIVSLLVAFFIACSVISEKFQITASAEDSNAMGPVGNFIGTLLLNLMDWCALVVPVWIAIAAIRYRKATANSPTSYKMTKLIGIIGAGVSFCVLASVLADAGGVIGSSIFGLVKQWFGVLGTFLVASSFLLFFLSLACQMTMSKLIKCLCVKSFSGTKKGAKGVCWGATKTVNGTVKSASIISNWVSGFITANVPDKEDLDDGEADGENTKYEFGKKIETPEEKHALMRKSVAKITHLAIVNKNNHQAENVDNNNDDDNDESLVRRDVIVTRRKKIAIPEKKVSHAPDEVVAHSLFHYTPPPLSLLAEGKTSNESEDEELLQEKSLLIEEKLRDFGINGNVTEVHPGPVITQFEFKPAKGVKVSKIAGLQDDLAMSLEARSIRIIAPIPGRGTVGIEIPNQNRELVRLRDVLESEAFVNAKSLLTVPLGEDIYGEPVAVDIAKMPHLLVAGATGAGKSVCINSFLLSFLYRASPADLGLILIDPKILEFSAYEGIPHLMVPVVTVPKQAYAVLEWAVKEMNRRYKLMSKYKIRNIDAYNKLAKGENSSYFEGDSSNIVMLNEAQMIEAGQQQQEEEPIAAEQIKPLPKIVIVIDELADLMLTVGHDIEDLITSLAQKARAAGIHLIIATQRPSVDVITGVIKANMGARLSFRVSSSIDSRTILNCAGAERLLGCGDMLVQMPWWDHLKRVHGTYVDDIEVQRVVDEVCKTLKPQYNPEILEICERALQEDSSKNGEDGDVQEHDVLYDRAVQFVMEKGQASTSMLQRAFSIGYNRAGRIIDMMEREGIVGPMDGSKPREVLGRKTIDDDLF